MAIWILFPLEILNWKGTILVTVPYLPCMSICKGTFSLFPQASSLLTLIPTLYTLLMCFNISCGIQTQTSPLWTYLLEAVSHISLGAWRGSVSSAIEGEDQSTPVSSVSLCVATSGTLSRSPVRRWHRIAITQVTKWILCLASTHQNGKRHSPSLLRKQRPKHPKFLCERKSDLSKNSFPRVQNTSALQVTLRVGKLNGSSVLVDGHRWNVCSQEGHPAPSLLQSAVKNEFKLYFSLAVLWLKELKLNLAKQVREGFYGRRKRLQPPENENQTEAFMAWSWYVLSF